MKTNEDGNDLLDWCFVSNSLFLIFSFIQSEGRGAEDFEMFKFKML